jgi:peptidoglycan/LPS O-acetylase OafA/YrhL
VHGNTICRVDSLLIGGALALLLRSRIHDRALRWAGWLVLIGAAAQISLRFVPAQAVNPLAYAVGNGLSYSALSATFVGLMAIALRGGAVTRLCEQRTLRWLGKYSYGLYVLHLPLFAYLQQPVRHILAPLLHENKGAVVAGTGIICFGLSVIAAYLSYNLYERRFLRLKRFFDYRRPDEKEPDRGETNREGEMQPAHKV